MLHIEDIKSFVHTDRDKKTEVFLSILTTLISGLIIIISISPAYLRELNPFTLFLLSISCALPVWAFNQLLWWYLGRRVTGEIVSKVAFVFDISWTEKKVLSFALVQLMKAVDIIRFIPTKNIANLVTVLAIYSGAVVLYFTSGPLPLLYVSIFLISLIAWLLGLLMIWRASNKIDVASLRETWASLKKSEDLLMYVNQQFERIEKMVTAETSRFIMEIKHPKSDLPAEDNGSEVQ